MTKTFNTMALPLENRHTRWVGNRQIDARVTIREILEAFELTSAPNPAVGPLRMDGPDARLRAVMWIGDADPTDLFQAFPEILTLTVTDFSKFSMTAEALITRIAGSSTAGKHGP